MICDARTCAGCRYLEDDHGREDDRAASLAEFLANCQHAKCKVVRLVRQQISKLQNMQYERFLITCDAVGKPLESEAVAAPGKAHEEPFSEVHQVHRDVRGWPYSEANESCGDVRESVSEVVAARPSEATTARDEPSAMHGEPVAAAERTVEAKNAATSAATASPPGAAFPGRAADRKWMLRVLDRVCHRAHLILAAAAVGLIVWSALVYGVFLGATVCGSGRTCLASSHQRARRSLF